MSPCDGESGNSADMVPPMPPVRTSSMDHLVHHASGADHTGLDYSNHGELDQTTAPPPGWDSCQSSIKNSRVYPSAPPLHAGQHASQYPGN